MRLRAWRNGRLMKKSIEYCNKNIAPKLRESHGKTVDVKVRNEAYKKNMIESNTLLMKSIGVSPWKSLSPLPLSIPLFLSFASGLRTIEYGDEGLRWIWRNFGDAAIESAVPVALSNFIYIEASRRRSTTNANGFLRTKLPFILGHSLNLLSFVLLTQVPSAVNFFLLNSSILSIIEGKLLMDMDTGKGHKNILERWIEKDFNEKVNRIDFTTRNISDQYIK